MLVCERMRPYGNDYTDLIGIVHERQGSLATIEFPKHNKKLSIPKYYIKNDLHSIKPNEEQMLKIESWILKKNRIIPYKSISNN